MTTAAITTSRMMPKKIFGRRTNTSAQTQRTDERPRGDVRPGRVAAPRGEGQPEGAQQHPHADEAPAPDVLPGVAERDSDPGRDTHERQHADESAIDRQWLSRHTFTRGRRGAQYEV